MFLHNKLELGSALNILEKFGKLSGLKLNLGKCEGFWLGKDKALQSHSRCFGIKWPEQLRCLGIYLGYNNQLNDKKNFDDKVEEIERILSKLEKRDLSFFGRIQIIKTFAVSKIVLSASTLCVPDYIVKRLEGILFKFLWQSKDKVTRVRMIQNVESGGLNMINIKAFCHSLSASWIIRILEGNPDEDNWVQLPRFFLKMLDIEGLNFKFNFDESVSFPDAQRIPLFYRQAFTYYNKALVTDKDLFENTIMNQSLWGNKYVVNIANGKKNVLFLRNWIRSGVRVVIGDLRFKNGILDEQFAYQKIACKQNIHCEIMLVKHALQPHQQILKQPITGILTNIKRFRSKEFYDMFKLQIIASHESMRISNFLAAYCAADKEMQAFSTKVVQTKEKKLKEFNFKLLHGILPCNKNLFRWKIRPYDIYDVCQEIQTIEHLLYDCSYVKPLWNIVDLVYGTKVNFIQILGLDELFNYGCVTTLICFLIYKEWLLLSLENKKRNSVIALEYFKNEIKLRIQIYEKCISVDPMHIQRLNELILYL